MQVTVKESEKWKFRDRSSMLSADNPTGIPVPLIQTVVQGRRPQQMGQTHQGPLETLEKTSGQHVSTAGSQALQSLEDHAQYAQITNHHQADHTSQPTDVGQVLQVIA